MKILIASDIHGSAVCCAKLLERMDEERADRLLLLGDLLYHGPRNDLPEGYEPKEVIRLLNERRSCIFAVRGNCEAEVDQMVLSFPVMADYCILPLERRVIYATHGHIYNEANRPPMMEGDILLHGHTHIPEARREKDYVLLNPGSVSIPKGGFPRSYAVLEDGVFTVRQLDGTDMMRLVLEEKT